MRYCGLLPGRSSSGMYVGVLLVSTPRLQDKLFVTCHFLHFLLIATVDSRMTVRKTNSRLTKWRFVNTLSLRDSFSGHSCR